MYRMYSVLQDSYLKAAAEDPSSKQGKQDIISLGYWFVY